MADTAIAIGELSRRTGCNIETIRYYERIGLIPRAARRGRYRSYGATDVGRLLFVRRARELGFTLEEIAALLGIAIAGQVNCGEARDIAAAHLMGVRKRLADLKRMERVLAATVAACDRDDHAGCPLIDTLSIER
ncbi:MAG: helix-turn-helix domain-containing protein [Sphingomonadales bacterium]|nr:helix-turn-helix domain-containing protein [Sphingomonadales bacterium]MDE2169314.1 helix-turn-helix domain-containing protein [Sphingomonadales bacterium]